MIMSFYSVSARIVRPIVWCEITKMRIVIFLREFTKVRTAGKHNTLDDHIVSTAVTQDREQLDCVSM